ncbi:MAG: glycoside hydrolase family 104 protein [Elusimicrobia bacterium]|nr:glycoside hydrolase family 104 protein [Elusimicrobiota bacterium]
MKRALLSLLLAAVPAYAGAQAFGELSSFSGGTSIPAPAADVPMAAPLQSAEEQELEQYLPPDNGEPGFEWPDYTRTQDQFFYIGDTRTFLKSRPAQSGELQDGTEKCVLEARTLYGATLKPGFTGEYMTVKLARPLPNCQMTEGYVYMADVSSSSAGGAWELPKSVRAFLDTLAFAEGTNERYNYIFTFATFSSYADHPRTRKCSGKLCSNAAGRYQFLSKTWDGLAPALGLSDFTPPNQEKAALEIIRRAGAYRLVSGSGVYENFTAALSRLNTTWASLPGSPYGQPTHSTASLWKHYKAALAQY